MKNCMDEQLVKATVVGIKWERVIVYIDVRLEKRTELKQDEELCFYAVNGSYKARAYFKQQPLEDGTIRLSVNITNPGECQC